jgi:hypothetical protein
MIGSPDLIGVMPAIFCGTFCRRHVGAMVRIPDLEGDPEAHQKRNDEGWNNNFVLHQQTIRQKTMPGNDRPEVTR